jgi:AGCS family alanine or glycine:cation symporter
MDFVPQGVIYWLNDVLWNFVLIYVLIGAGLYFSIRTRWVQFRLLKPMIATLRGSRSEAAGGISSFQAFCVGLASRVGTGNIAGVSIALTLGGPGAIFWMWLVGMVGMSTAFVEATLAQIFKVRSRDGSFRGGPAFYIQQGLGSRRFGAFFAVLLIVTFGIAFNMVQANTIGDVLYQSHTIGLQTTGVILMLLAAPVLFGGVRRVSQVAEYVLPIMALVYLALAFVIIAANIGEVPGMIGDIVRGAFGVDEALAGTAGGLSAALLNGVKRGLFSNEAGMGSAPNAAATATTSHPAKQGLIQALGVFVDTVVICTATAFIVMLGGDVYQPGEPEALTGAPLTQAAVAAQFGDNAVWIMTVIVVTFAFSSVIGNYAYAEINLTFLGAPGWLITAFRIVVIGSVGVGTLIALEAVWNFADVTMALMALTNLVAILLIGKWAFAALADYERQRTAGADPTFSRNTGDLPAPLTTDAWPSR